ncbi:hypothetical protein NDU88_002253 [Pleurodeles waltl]|uniref:Secreted protein n=1 Tax=Pleurodeles waltl TaxID=8319 RepID=A0AAV7NLH2_PLEWA|nr:hypothetical protein NDU88_002253 [Pleurodeles waltl]
MLLSESGSGMVSIILIDFFVVDLALMGGAATVLEERNSSPRDERLAAEGVVGWGGPLDTLCAYERHVGDSRGRDRDSRWQDDRGLRAVRAELSPASFFVCFESVGPAVPLCRWDGRCLL